MIALILFVIPWAWSAPHRDHFPEAVSYFQVRQLIQQEDNEDAIKKLGPEAYKRLRDVMATRQETVENRWRATLAIAKIGGEDSLPDLELAINNSEWFMRSAGLLGLTIAQPEKGRLKARQFLHSDPALLVRATALQILAQQRNVDKNFLWSELYNPLNFKNGRGLPIRLSILKVIDKSVTPSDASKLTALMRENNKEIQSVAKASLNKIFSASSDSFTSR